MASLDSCRAELRSIISELRSIEYGIRSDFTNIGQDLCANCVSAVADRYQYSVLPALNNVRENVFAEWFNSGDD